MKWLHPHIVKPNVWMHGQCLSGQRKDQGGPLPSSCPGIIPFIDIKWRPRDKIRAKEIYEQWKQSLELQILPDLNFSVLSAAPSPPLHWSSPLPTLPSRTSQFNQWKLDSSMGRCPPRTSVSPLPTARFLVRRLREYLRIPSLGWEAKAAPPT